MFSQATSLGILSLGQLVNGLGQSMGWTSSLKLIVSWFPRSQRATAIGFFATCVTAGSSFGIRLSGLLGDHLGWRSSFIIPPVLLAMVALFFWMMAKDSPRERGLPDFDDEIHLEKRIENDPRSRLSLVLTNRILWSVALVYFCFVYVQFGCLVWIPSFLKEAYAMSVDRASTISALVLLPGVGRIFIRPLFQGKAQTAYSYVDVHSGVSNLFIIPECQYHPGYWSADDRRVDDHYARRSIGRLSFGYSFKKIVGHRHGIPDDIH
jgi:predicted MFS family arabinose efflux permease